jgi:hypothetical protein
LDKDFGKHLASLPNIAHVILDLAELTGAHLATNPESIFYSSMHIRSAS